MGLVEPVDEKWTVGQLSVGVDEANGLILVTAEELVADSVEIDPQDRRTRTCWPWLEAAEWTRPTSLRRRGSCRAPSCPRIW
ncbi:MAG: hypothetical protein R2716_05585 [Microthrixaceae bacterium]